MEDRVRTRMIPGASFLPKPFLPDALARLLFDVLDEAQASSRGRIATSSPSGEAGA